MDDGTDSAAPRKLSLTPILDLPGLTVLRSPFSRTPSGPPVVVFGSIRKKGASPEFMGTLATLDRTVLHVMEHDFGFYATAPRLARFLPLIEAEMAAGGHDAVDTVGFSMGGYGAMAVAAVLPVRRAIALSPRFSPDPAQVRDPRFRPLLQARSGTFVLPTIEAGMRRVEWGMIVHGRFWPDLLHLYRFARVRTVDHWFVPEADHFTGQWLRRRGILRDVLCEALCGTPDRVAPLLRDKGALPRHGIAGRTAAGLKFLSGALRKDNLRFLFASRDRKT